MNEFECIENGPWHLNERHSAYILARSTDTEQQHQGPEKAKGLIGQKEKKDSMLVSK